MINAKSHKARRERVLRRRGGSKAEHCKTKRMLRVSSNDASRTQLPGERRWETAEEEEVETRAVTAKREWQRGQMN